jgi:hypothetical protein
VYIVLDAGQRLLGAGAEPHASLLGIVLAATSLVVMPLLAIPPTWSTRLAIGLVALGLLLVAEFTVVLWLRGLTIREYILSRDPAAGTVYIGMLGLFAIMPLLVARRSDGLIGTP